jgi:hypothetical protein
MGDWTFGAVTIYSCPPHRVRTVMDVLDQHGLTNQDTADTRDTWDGRKTVDVGEPYGAASFRGGGASEVAHDLIRTAPEVAFTAYEEPAYNGVGGSCSYVPRLGLFTSDCTTSGDPVFTQAYVLQLDTEPADVRQTKLGVPWLTAITAMTHGTVTEPESFAVHWNRRHREVIVVDGKRCGADLIFAAPSAPDTDRTAGTDADTDAIDALLTERGFRRASDWTPLDETCQVWRTDVYQSSSHTAAFSAPFTWTTPSGEYQGISFSGDGGEYIMVWRRDNARAWQPFAQIERDPGTANWMVAFDEWRMQATGYVMTHPYPAWTAAHREVRDGTGILPGQESDTGSRPHPAGLPTALRGHRAVSPEPGRSCDLGDGFVAGSPDVLR